jgi:hypothetical protein
VDELRQQPLHVEPRQAFRPAHIPGAIGPLTGVLLLVRRSHECGLKPIRGDQPPSSDERFLAGEDGLARLRLSSFTRETRQKALKVDNGFATTGAASR